MRSLKLAGLILVITAIPALIGYLALGLLGLYISLAILLVLHLIVIFAAPTLIIDFAHGTLADKEKYESLYQTIEEMCRFGKLPMPKLYIAPSPQANAMLVGNSERKTHLIITRGLLEFEKDEEAIAIMAQAISSGNLEIAEHTMVSAYASLITRIAQIGHFSILKGSEQKEKGNSISSLIFFVLAPIASFILKSVVHRERHYKADFEAAKLIRDPKTLSKALVRIEQQIEGDIPLINPNPSLSHLFVVHPFHTRMLSSLFNVHPSIDSRITKLHNMKL